ncbi:uncharacterized protein LOC131161607 [Malania oleifera]|uniref:uncharacterized protein LOC131161607 n=1 Tax=Malania oleifera TaxID=397392 RepID=UPI0025ADBA57|nr:uncharacterized protein LOC131161607 [Malania oleifera]
MSSSKSSISTSSPKRLLFDRRYGWVIDDWRDPSEEALAGGRGMFCALPLAKALLKTASQSINLVTFSTIKVLEKPDLLHPRALQACLEDHFHKLISSVQQPEFNLFAIKRDSPLHFTGCSSNLPVERCESRNS